MTEDMLARELKQGVVRKAYYFYGKEVFLVKTYAARVLKSCLDEADYDFNLVKISSVPDVAELAESVETLPVFAEKRVVMLNDLDAEKLSEEDFNDLVKILSDIPDTTCVIISITGITPDMRKAKTKKLIACADKYGGICEFSYMSEAKTAELIEKRVKRTGCRITRDNAVYLSQLCLRDLTLIGAETDKLCAYVGENGEVDKTAIDQLVAKRLEAGVFALAAEITARRAGGAMRLLDELITLGNPPIAVTAALAATFIDFYRAKLGSAAGYKAAKIAADFNYAKNREWAVGKAIGAVYNMPLEKIKRCLNVLCDADYKLKSSPVNDRVIIERAVSELLGLC